MTPEVTRRRALEGIGGALAVAGARRGRRPRSAPAGVSEADRTSEFPRYVYQRGEDGGWHPTMPVNLRAYATGGRAALDAVTERFSGPSGWRWTQFFPDATVRAWIGELTAPDYSVRRPRLGDGWNHVHAWALGPDRVAIHAHLDVVDAGARYLHSGDDYHVAARQVRELFTDGDWTATPFSVEYGREGDWGETGDTELRRR